MHKMEEMYTAWTPTRAFQFDPGTISCAARPSPSSMGDQRGTPFADSEGPAGTVQTAMDALRRPRPVRRCGLAELHRAVAVADKRFQGLDIDWARQVTVARRGREVVTASLIAVPAPGDPLDAAVVGRRMPNWRTRSVPMQGYPD